MIFNNFFGAILKYNVPLSNKSKKHIKQDWHYLPIVISIIIIVFGIIFSLKDLGINVYTYLIQTSYLVTSYFL